mgnify:CR=1 FL=1|jgi:hypothetical protein
MRIRCEIAQFVMILLFAFVIPASAGDNAEAIFSIVGGDQTASVRPGERVMMLIAASGLQEVQEVEISPVLSSEDAFDLAATAYEIPVQWFSDADASVIDAADAPALFSVGFKVLDRFNAKEKTTITVDEIAIASLGSERDEFSREDLDLSLAVAPAQTAVLAGALPIAATVLDQNYPNPFNPETNIHFDLSEVATVTLVIYNLKGQAIRTLVVGQDMVAGVYNMIWDGRTTAGDKVGSGVYFYQLRAGSFTATKKMTLLQ